jgi:predicted CoA-binding protein
MDAEYAQYVQEFLGYKRIGIAGLSSKNDNPGNFIYKKLKDNGYQVVGINPKATEMDGVECYPTIASVPVALEGIVICTHPSITESVIEESANAGIKIAWIHKAIGEGSYSKTAIAKARKMGIKIIPVGCPMMFVKPDFFHKCFKFFLKKKFKVE